MRTESCKMKEHNTSPSTLKWVEGFPFVNCRIHAYYRYDRAKSI